jgi:hypothetical protein
MQYSQSAHIEFQKLLICRLEILPFRRHGEITSLSSHKVTEILGARTSFSWVQFAIDPLDGPILYSLSSPCLFGIMKSSNGNPAFGIFASNQQLLGRTNNLDAEHLGKLKQFRHLIGRREFDRSRDPLHQANTGLGNECVETAGRRQQKGTCRCLAPVPNAVRDIPRSEIAFS